MKFIKISKSQQKISSDNKMNIWKFSILKMNGINLLKEMKKKDINWSTYGLSNINKVTCDRVIWLLFNKNYQSYHHTIATPILTFLTSIDLCWPHIFSLFFFGEAAVAAPFTNGRSFFVLHQWIVAIGSLEHSLMDQGRYRVISKIRSFSKSRNIFS